MKKQNTVKNPSSVKIARGQHRGHNWCMWRDEDLFVVQMAVTLGKLGGIDYMAECDATFDGVLDKIKARADRSIDNYTRKWPSDPVIA